MHQRPLRTLSTTLASAALAMLAACGGGSGSSPTAGPAPVASGLSGAVAVGAPMTDATVRVLDATGTVVASGIAVAADGSYNVPTLTGTGPWRIEACGHVGANYQCIYSVAQTAGTANVTPLTTATMLLATGRQPEELMSGAASGLGSSAVNTAQQQLRTGLASVMSGNVPADFDFIGGSLTAGARTGYDRLLDSVGVSTGTDDAPFVQITPRMGQGNLFLQQGSTQGSVQANSQAANMSLEGLESLFRGMSAAMASQAACVHGTTGMASFVSANARMSMEEALLEGGANVASGLCEMMGMENMWGSNLLSPVLGRCNLGGASPVCRVTFVMKDAQGNIEPVGEGMAVTQESGRWKFMGDADAVRIRAQATVQRDDHRSSESQPALVQYTRALSFDIPALPGLACAQLTQRNADGQARNVAYFKRYPSGNPRRLSLWTQNAFSNERSLDVANGHLRSDDDTWLMLPEGADGDAVVRNFLRGGRSVTVNLFGDAACSQPFTVAGLSSVEVEIEGVPPVWAALPSLPWPQIASATHTGLRTLALDTGAGAEYTAAMAVSGNFGLREVTVCADRPTCGEGGNGRLGQARVRPNAAQAIVGIINATGAPVTADQSKTVSFNGRNPEGVMLQYNYNLCVANSENGFCR